METGWAADVGNLLLAWTDGRVLEVEAAAARVKVRAGLTALEGLALAGEVEGVGLGEGRGGDVDEHADGVGVGVVVARGLEAGVAAGDVVGQVRVPEDVVAGLEGGKGDHAAAEVEVRVPAFGDALGVAGDGAVDDGVGVALELPVVGVQVGVPFGAGADIGGGRLCAEEGAEEVVGRGELGRGEEADHAWLDGGEGEDTLEHAEDGTGAVAVVQVHGGGDTAVALPRVVGFPVALEDARVGARAAVAVGLPALERAVVDLGDDAGRRLQGHHPVVGGLGLFLLRFKDFLEFVARGSAVLVAAGGRGRGGPVFSVGFFFAVALGEGVVEGHVAASRAVDTDTVDVGDGEPGGQSILWACLPETHHEALGVEDGGVRTRANLRRRPEEVVACGILFQRLEVLRATRIEVLHRAVDHVVGVLLGYGAADDTDTVAAKVAAETGRLGWFGHVAILDGRDEVGAETFDVVHLGAQGVDEAVP